MTYFEDFAKVCSAIEHISGSLEITTNVSNFLKEVSDEELPIVTRFIMGHVFPVWSNKELGLGPNLLYSAISRTSSLPVKRIEELIKETGDVGLALEKAILCGKTHLSLFSESEQLSIKEVYLRFERISELSGKGSQDAKIKNLQYLFSQAKPTEIVYLSRLAIEEMRIGVGEGIVRNAIAEAFGVPSELVERGILLTNDSGLVAITAKKEGKEGLIKLGVMINRPLRMMLAQIGAGINETIKEMGHVAVEWKYDGARVQIHKNENDITIYSRKLEDVTSSLPDLVKSIRTNVLTNCVILDGEAVAIGKNNRPKPFQEILRRFRRKYDVSTTAIEIPLCLNLFDILYLNGDSLIDIPLIKRREKLEKVCDKSVVAKQIITDDPAVVESIYNEALAAGHEGVMLKNPGSPYSPGKRGKNWLKLKPIMETLDLVVIGGEWGEGRRTKFIGSYLLACRDPDTEKFLPIGRVATGITDEQLEDLTKLFKDLIILENGIHVDIEPKIVFEVAFEEIQKSPNYGSGYALRFPRLVNVRTDKSKEDADSIERIEQLYIRQKGR
ncbi:MAG: DNA ligase (ATP) [Candidatus Methanoperedens nitroreducens]|uniref:DNA ligase n=1 Tax=Candidatus Methanoperedens nitratireducens TaxID=1392998 RepID=A0A0P8E1N0_9EURY|nr:ATP-dependent DNA ligase [Candidatus Methanoperedens sp. BLZ2]KAB2948119.1 MAG: ATP-dependent DNA ligase [Candidatus Methanoperedens sp.]KPQ44104.1 MAG: DNA ligase (ATP) [Candidatus Methanoperedens sp. BLZ1]MBZ0174005.1 ATP-dependent DNA ligase [Candidatus Methanoperedens nitroreducens]CAG0960846.1 DNA ligase B [Methanosarcinales archaeon]MCX9079023.1 ATP-dependent DNA ligase [Candidatus Methanoperedens sp.]